MKTFSTSYHKTTGWKKKLPNVDSPQTLILIFGSSFYLDFLQPFQALKQQYPQSVIAGCSTAGEILGDEILDDSLVISISHFDHTAVRLFSTPIISMEDSYHSGETVASHLIQDDLSSILVLADGLNTNGTDLVKGINAKLQGNCIKNGLTFI